ncbi:DNA alkylation repair protein [Paenibacillus sacheonensis]|uniref:DNA alkylation repair protein n=1 Tax=Paenibacillus sacheonensis TaxID=742054 RepID=A0A7X4YV33_9BACL|nr:DNA alkylation repair protein [Paenibacillus sacheonensis]MBM7566577.1 3-methyladenine DNA glycosylase AlkD [Paenibacillus sacheonensis]NBC73077.1 DNA alkylation repair protein [Paenibacillus sacheonensis]
MAGTVRTGSAAAYADKLETLLRSHANAEQTVEMKAYMRDQFSFLGIRTPERAALTKPFMKEHGVPAMDELGSVVRLLWALPEREFHYTAMLLMEKRKKELGPERMELLEHLITTKSWWDTVDLLASHLAGAAFGKHPELVPAYVEKWIGSDNLWLRRSAILYQLGYKDRTDAALLFSLIRRTAHESDFFMRKAIGWALREYGKSDPDAVRAFVRETELSPLSVREALKHIGE